MSEKFDKEKIEREIAAEVKSANAKQKTMMTRIVIVAALEVVLFGTFLVLNNDNDRITIGDGEYETIVETSRLLANISNPNNPAVVLIMDGGEEIVIELFPEHAPITVANFVHLVETEFYDGLTFHRIMHNFMMQGGDPIGNGSGGSDQSIVCEFSQNGIDNPLRHTRGAVSMARLGNDNDSASSQFFIVQNDDSNFLDGMYAVFGFVIYGIDAVDEIINSSNPLDSNGTILFAEQPVIRVAAVIN